MFTAGKLANEDRALPLVLAPSKFCPRQLTPHATKMNPEACNAKRYMGVGKPLFGYMIACPACSFVEMHEDRKAGFVEVEGRLVGASSPLTCLHCRRTLSIAGGVIAAMMAVSITPAVT